MPNILQNLIGTSIFNMTTALLILFFFTPAHAQDLIMREDGNLVVTVLAMCLLRALT
ncbi:hypothetical protein OAK32_00300 [Mariniblastus sp.]|nr:hypothetical protein [Mariniblastus sp.]